MTVQAAIYGCAGHRLTGEEIRFFQEHNPLGLILFARNIDHPAQVQALIEEFRACLTHDKPLILVDQEGGRVARLGPPYWPKYPAAAAIGALFKADAAKGREAAFAVGRLIAEDLAALGFNVACAPVLDLTFPETHAVIGTRAYGAEVEAVAALGRAMADGLLAGGVLPVIKHIPGHGRAAVDSHFELPRVDTPLATLQESDFAAFRRLNGLPLAMTAHVIYSAIDPESPATTSAKIVQSIIRADIGFEGLLMTDDLSMQALTGSMEARVAGALAAGCDIILHCNGEMQEMQEIANACGPMTDEQNARAALAAPHAGDDADLPALRALVANFQAEGV